MTMRVKDERIGEKVAVLNADCLRRPCYWPRPDPGVYTQGVGYRERSGKCEWLCGNREIRGCPVPIPEPMGK